MQSKSLFKTVISLTYINLAKMLDKLNNPDKEKPQDGRAKNILKNIGRWLGYLTLARNKPIVLKYLNIKQLLIDAFYLKKLQLVLPLVCKILESSK